MIAPPPTATKSRLAMDCKKHGSVLASSRTLGTVINDFACAFSINIGIERDDGIRDADGKQDGFPVARLMHGLRRPRPFISLVSVSVTVATGASTYMIHRKRGYIGPSQTLIGTQAMTGSVSEQVSVRQPNWLGYARGP